MKITTDNVQVAVRVRNIPSWHGRDPNSIKHTDEYNRNIAKVDGKNPKTGQYTAVAIEDPEQKKDDKSFNFDSVFSGEDGQETIYNRLVRPIVEKCLEGFNGCIFTYGQTASGKTYTMGGPEVKDPKDKGIILRVASQIVAHIEKNGRKDASSAGIDYKVSGSFLEIYNEQLKDLLCDANKQEDLKIRLDPRSATGKDLFVQGLTELSLITENDYSKVIATGVQRRVVAETNMNAVSSRSHSVLTITIMQTEKIPGKPDGIMKRSKIHLIDLAGSERAESTGATGALLKEGAAINQSLSCLGNVINALSTGSTHVPYRDSKLTYLLSDSLGGNSITLLIACLTPIAGAYEETLSTLRFAERAKKVKNKAQINVDATTLRIMELEAENAELKRQLASCICGAQSNISSVSRPVTPQRSVKKALSVKSEKAGRFAQLVSLAVGGKSKSIELAPYSPLSDQKPSKNDEKPPLAPVVLYSKPADDEIIDIKTEKDNSGAVSPLVSPNSLPNYSKVYPDSNEDESAVLAPLIGTVDDSKRDSRDVIVRRCKRMMPFSCTLFVAIILGIITGYYFAVITVKGFKPPSLPSSCGLLGSNSPPPIIPANVTNSSTCTAFVTVTIDTTITTTVALPTIVPEAEPVVEDFPFIDLGTEDEISDSVLDDTSDAIIDDPDPNVDEFMDPEILIDNTDNSTSVDVTSPLPEENEPFPTEEDLLELPIAVQQLHLTIGHMKSDNSTLSNRTIEGNYNISDSYFSSNNYSYVKVDHLRVKVNQIRFKSKNILANDIVIDMHKSDQWLNISSSKANNDSINDFFVSFESEISNNFIYDSVTLLLSPIYHLQGFCTTNSTLLYTGNSTVQNTTITEQPLVTLPEDYSITEFNYGNGIPISITTSNNFIFDGSTTNVSVWIDTSYAIRCWDGNGVSNLPYAFSESIINTTSSDIDPALIPTCNYGELICVNNFTGHVLYPYTPDQRNCATDGYGLMCLNSLVISSCSGLNGTEICLFNSYLLDDQYCDENIGEKYCFVETVNQVNPDPNPSNTEIDSNMVPDYIIETYCEKGVLRCIDPVSGLIFTHFNTQTCPTDYFQVCVTGNINCWEYGGLDLCVKNGLVVETYYCDEYERQCMFDPGYQKVVKEHKNTSLFSIVDIPAFAINNNVYPSQTLSTTTYLITKELFDVHIIDWSQSQLLTMAWNENNEMVAHSLSNADALIIESLLVKEQNSMNSTIIFSVDNIVQENNQTIFDRALLVSVGNYTSEDLVAAIVFDGPECGYQINDRLGHSITKVCQGYLGNEVYYWRRLLR